MMENLCFLHPQTPHNVPPNLTWNGDRILVLVTHEVTLDYNVGDFFRKQEDIVHEAEDPKNLKKEKMVVQEIIPF